MVPTSRGGIGVEAGTCSLGKSSPAYQLPSALSPRRRPQIKAYLRNAAPFAASCTVLQKATMTLRIEWSSGWGLWGEVGGTDLAAPAPNAHLELGPMPVGCRINRLDIQITHAMCHSRSASKKKR
jgi:hypothetical protein